MGAGRRKNEDDFLSFLKGRKLRKLVLPLGRVRGKIYYFLMEDVWRLQ
jgi:hypothetical protein